MSYINEHTLECSVLNKLKVLTYSVHYSMVKTALSLRITLFA